MVVTQQNTRSFGISKEVHGKDISREGSDHTKEKVVAPSPFNAQLPFQELHLMDFRLKPRVIV